MDMESTVNEFDISIAAGKLYLEEHSADVHFLVKDNKGEVERIPSHKILLAAASDTFYRMFYGDGKEKCNVTIVDASTLAFKEFLQCFYFERVKLTVENVGEVMYLCEKYGIGQCKAACTKLLLSNLTADNVCRVYPMCAGFIPSSSIKLTSS